MSLRIAIIGGGAAGFFAAIKAKETTPDAIVTIYEKGKKPLAKVGITGGGRCNLTNSFSGISDLKKVYPRGDKLMKRLFNTFDYQDTFRWFEKHGVPLVIQDDECVFPRSQDAQSVVRCLVDEAHRLGIATKTGHSLSRIERSDDAMFLFFNDSDKYIVAERVVIATGGHAYISSFDYIASLGHSITEPAPSLFTFNIADKALRGLMGTVVKNVSVGIVGEKMRGDGPLLITHWGMSGPAVLRLSSYAARLAHERKYRFDISVNWIGQSNMSVVAENIAKTARENAAKKVGNVRPYDLPTRLWDYLVRKMDVASEKRWDETGKKWQNKIVEILTNDVYHVDGKSKWRDEFVICGGVSLSSINPNTLESKHLPGLYFAGEVTDVDAVTGGFNLQAAWTMGYVAGGNAAK
ncbi:MAG: NAD(P)/FAD-dependent oxidoreductase [Prevotella sp.]|uniref:NAD(P)/FAD-dependent oxidoreductase n=1 Tax=Prevotella sp. TaxID=59823 RepID=UPI002A2887FA|nr:NAD(P)/FAD-dependent oxidoreductase [Prevotella sp.]MDD7319159.1 NAD(P)/FAD-dependent oxidoreductase [Prevotellaceae bacterium]MDY4020027.1 NAD(P)/FAD-dependent oxidoreductase [Prevotella sp.]